MTRFLLVVEDGLGKNTRDNIGVERGKNKGGREREKSWKETEEWRGFGERLHAEWFKRGPTDAIVVRFEEPAGAVRLT